ncbi:hypothetical protein CS063_14610 [Sporanaerobium hydrogeniformans]|uniref:Uncharacterized protein n=1 Tax=Sporanaerobium hydrogeniformans TaxID=3072179 RepID=A0AC61DAF3_9FIRM|nr:hypothetical protein [Sporanaerobium hydrogeniformans]PHV69651.1 hypothetical protein CS063_14610 [Sporanaerobium hydrogeniformans]
MNVLNGALCLLLVGMIILEILFIVRRNRTIHVRGKDDFFTYALIVFGVFLFCPVREDASLLESLRNVLLYVVLFGSVGVKRGISSKGIEKFGFTITWEQIIKIEIEEHLSSQMTVIIYTHKGKLKLLFNKYLIGEVLRALQNHVEAIYIQESLDKVLKLKKKNLKRRREKW